MANIFDTLEQAPARTTNIFDTLEPKKNIFDTLDQPPLEHDPIYGFEQEPPPGQMSTPGQPPVVPPIAAIEPPPGQMSTPEQPPVDVPVKSPAEGLKEKARFAGMNHFQSAAGGGYTAEQAAGIIGNLAVESGDFDPNVISGKRRGDNGKAIGIAQWRAARQKDFKDLYGKPIEKATLAEQLAFVTHELNSGKEQKAGRALRGATDAKSAAAIIDKMYERSAGLHLDRRVDKAESLLVEAPGEEPASEPIPVTDVKISQSRQSVTSPAGNIFDTLVPPVEAAVTPPPPPEKKEWSVFDLVKDAVITGVKGAIGVPESFIGLLDIVSGGRAGLFAQKTLGFDPKQAKEILSEWYSADQKEAFKNVQDAEGFWNVMKTAIKNPSVIAHTAAESLPLMGAGGTVARGFTKVAPWIAAAIGEGAVGAGLAAEGTRQETKDGRLTGKQSAMAVASGVGTGIFNLVGGRLSKKFGFEDVDTMIAAGKRSVPKGISKNMAGKVKDVSKRIVAGGISEGIFEELPQSVQEQLWANAALGRPLGEGIDQAAGLGLLTGAAMGSGVNVISGVSPDFDAIDFSGIQQDPDLPPPKGKPAPKEEGIPIEDPPDVDTPEGEAVIDEGMNLPATLDDARIALEDAGVDADMADTLKKDNDAQLLIDNSFGFTRKQAAEGHMATAQSILYGDLAQIMSDIKNKYITQERALEIYKEAVAEGVAIPEKLKQFEDRLDAGSSKQKRKSAQNIVRYIDVNSTGELDLAGIKTKVQEGGEVYEKRTFPLDNIKITQDMKFLDPRDVGNATEGPIVISQSGEIIDGRHRVAKALAKGEKSIETYYPVPTKKPTPATVTEKDRKEGVIGLMQTKPNVFDTLDRRQKKDAPETERREGERRIDAINRKKVDDMSMGERKEALLTSQKTGLKNNRAYKESDKKELQAMLDIDSLKWVNDNFGHTKGGDALLQLLGKAFEGNEDAYHISGDEFVLQGTKKEIAASVAKAKKYLKAHPMDLAGSPFVPKFSYATDPKLDVADKKMLEEKLAREIAGKRAGRGRTPGHWKRPKGWISAAEKEKLAKKTKRAPNAQALKEYKTGLQSEIAAALKKAEKKPLTYLEAQDADKIKIGETFRILNHVPALQAFKKLVDKLAVTPPKKKPAKPKKKTVNRLNKRVEGFAGDSIASYKPRKSLKLPELERGKEFAGFYGEGWYVANGLAIKTKDPKTKRPLDKMPKNFIESLTEKDPEMFDAEIGAETYSSASGEKGDGAPQVHIYSNDMPKGKEYVKDRAYNPIYLDAVFKAYPKATVSLTKEGWAIFKNDGEIVAKAMPLSAEVSAAAMARRKKPTPGGFADTGGYADTSEPTVTLKTEMANTPGFMGLSGQFAKAVAKMKAMAMGSARIKDGKYEIKYADYQAIQDFIDQVRGDIISNTESGQPSADVNDMFRKIKNDALTRDGRDIVPDNGSYADQTPYIFEFRADWEKIVESIDKPIVEWIGETAEGESMYSVRGKGYSGNTLKESDLIKEGIPLPKESGPKRIEQGYTDVGKGHADTGGYADTSSYADTSEQTDTGMGTEKLVLELPEIVQLAKAIMDGKYPGIVRRIAAVGGKALGVFYAAGKNATIDLRADLFTNSVDAAKTLAHEIGHFIDYLPDRLMSRGNILGHMASLKGYLKHSLPNAPGAPGPLTDKDRARLRYQAKKLTEAKDNEIWIDEVIRKESPVTPDDILAIWKSMEDDIDPELHLYVKKLNRAQKKAIMKDAMKGVVGAELQQFAKVVETKTGKKVKQTISDAEVTEMIKKKYVEMINEEIAKRRLFDLDVITDELKALTLAWKPFDPKHDSRFTQYRFSAVELYADAFSVLINQPGMLKSIAPNFYEGFFNYLEMKPEAQEAYLKVQASMNKQPIERAKEHLENIYKMFRKSSLKRQVAEKEKKKGAVSTFDFLMKNLWDRSHAVLKIARSLPDKKVFQKAKLAIQELQHTASPISAYLSDYNEMVLDPLEKSGHTYDELNAQAFYKRIAEGDRGDKANPLGIDQPIARRDLALMGEEIWGKEKFKEIEGILKKFRGLREQELYPILRESGLLKEELMDYIEENQHHVKWDVAEHFNKLVGKGSGAKIYQQIGTLKEIDHPITATMLQDVSLLRAARINLAKKDVLQMLVASGDAKRASMRYSKDVGGRVPQHMASDKGLFIVMQKGKPQYFEVDADIAAMFEFDPMQAQQLTNIWRVVSQPLREAFVGKNVPWMARNLVRDFTATVKNIPGMRLRHIPRLMYNYLKVAGEVQEDIFGIQVQQLPKRMYDKLMGNTVAPLNRAPSARIRDMRKNYGLPHFRTWSGKDQTFDAEIERMLTEFRVIPKADNQAEGLKQTMYQMWEAADGLGLMSEVWGKVAADRFLDTHKKFKMDRRQRAQVTRELAGTPDAKQRSAQYSFLNNIFMFSEMRKAGIRQMITAYKADKAGYIWKTFALNVLPKTAKYLMLAAGGAIPLSMYAASGGDDDEVKNKIKQSAKIWTRIPEHDKMMYDCVPLGMTDDGKAMYLALPKDYEGQIFGTLGYLLGKAIMDDQTSGYDTAREIFKLAEQQKPYSLHALLGVFGDWIQYGLGDNPEDWKGYKVVPRRVFETGDWTYLKESFPYMARHTWRSLGGGVIYKPGYDNVAQDRKTYEKLLSVPPLNGLGTFVRFSDRGLTEEINARLGNYRQEKAGKWLTADQQMKAMLDGGLSEKEIEDALINPDVTAKKMEKIIKNRAYTDPYVKALSKATKIEQAIIINMISEENK